MNQEKIGQFIAKCRKDKKLTQQELAEKLGVTDRSISNWENARCMPDLSLFKPLCDELGISINDLISGEVIDKSKYQEKLEENIINTIDYSNKKINQKNNNIGLILLVFGVVISFTAMSIFASESSWGSIYAVIGAIIAVIGIAKLTKKLSYSKRLLCNYGYFIIHIALLFLIDYIGVITIHQAPRFSYLTQTGENMIIYNTPFYNVYRINRDTVNEYYILDKEKKYTNETLPITPFDREKSGIDNIIKYKNKYIGNNSNTGNLINNLPLSEYGYIFKIDSTNLGLFINYHVTDWYINQNNYLEKSLVYNSIAIFALIDNVDYLEFNFSGEKYRVTRKQIMDIYPNANMVITKNINKDKFNTYVEKKMNDTDFITDIFNKIYKM